MTEGMIDLIYRRTNDVRHHFVILEFPKDINYGKIRCIRYMRDEVTFNQWRIGELATTKKSCTDEEGSPT
jgi:hypothetical protein